MIDLPAPMTPADCNLRGLPFMPLEVGRLIDSDLFLLSTGDEFKAAVALWCKSWNQEPGGSLPNDERMLAKLSGADNWKKVRDMALRGWILCSDGRLYHQVVAAVAISAWDRREGYREKNNNKDERQQRWRERCKDLAKQLRDLGITPPKGAGLEALEGLLSNALEERGVDDYASTPPSTVDKGEIGKTGTGTGTVKEVSSSSTVVNQREGQITALQPSRIGELCQRLRHTGVQASPGMFAKSEWLTVLSRFDNDVVVSLAETKRAAMPAKSITAAYLLPALQDMLTSSKPRINGGIHAERQRVLDQLDGTDRGDDESENIIDIQARYV